MHKTGKNIALFASITTSLLFLSACGGGSDAAVDNNVPPTSNVPVWTQGVFQAESTFVNQCEAPRTGINPATGNAFADVQGSTLLENNWLRSWSNATYLWYEEIVDQNPANFSDRLEYFDVLKTNETTSSGSPKDNFHFSTNTAEYQELVSSGSVSGYGATLTIISPTVPRELRVTIVQAGTSASDVNLMRGAEILEIDGVDVVNASTQAEVDIINAGLRPASDGEVHNFVVRDAGSTITRNISMTSGTFETDAVLETRTISTSTGNVGYILYDTFQTEKAEEQIVNAVTQLVNEGAQDLVLDLRYNRGGFLDIAAQLAYMIAGDQTQGKTFSQVVRNDKFPAVSPLGFLSRGIGLTVPTNQTLPTLNLNRVFILSTGGTCSASEAVINGLRGIDVEVILIGTRTCGKPYGFRATDNCGETYFTIQLRGDNAKGFGEFSDGFTPMNAASPVGELITGCEVPDDYLNQLGDESEAMLATALSYRANGSCPALSTSNVSAKQDLLGVKTMSLHEKLNNYEEGSLFNSDYMRDRILLELALNQGTK